MQVMKGLSINIPSCTSEDSINIISSNMEFNPSSSSTTSSSSATIGSRAIDRHNPIITDEKRSGFSNSCTNTPIRTPLTNNILQRKPTTNTAKKSSFGDENCVAIHYVTNDLVTENPVAGPTPQFITSPSPLKKKGNKFPTFTKKSSKRNAATKPPMDNNSKNMIDGGDKDDDHNKSGRRSFSKPSDLIMKASSACGNTRAGVDYISPPESSRYLLDDTSFLEVLSDFDPVSKLVHSNPNTQEDNVEILKPECSETPEPSSISGPSDQVVILRVSLHCRGCERKMKKHLSRMAGVRSFNIDFAAKKVTVVGDVTPLGVLASISKVKTAQLWTPTIQSSTQSNYSKLMQHKKYQ